MADWFEEWFSSDEYLALYKHRNQDEAEQLTKLILSRIRLNSEGRALDLACGNGRHALFLAKAGFVTYGIDLSAYLIREAALNAGRKELPIHFIRADLRAVPLKNSFDLIVNLFTSFGYFEKDEENFNVFRQAAGLLKENGIFAFDFFNSRYVEKNLVPCTTEERGGGTIIQNRCISSGRVIKKIEFLKNEKKREFIESVRLFTPGELMEGLRSAGLTPFQIFGNYQGEDFKTEESDRFIALCKKK